jgi:ribosomal-protein-alanine N-acetyltransferase
MSPDILTRRVYKDDLKDLYEVYSDPDVMKYARDPVFGSFEMMEQFFESVEKGYKSGEYYEFAIVFNGEKVVGTCSLHSFDTEKNSAEIGYLLAKKYWHRGIMFEAVNLLTHYAFNDLALKTIIADVDLDNIASRRLLLKLGFRRVEGNNLLFYKTAKN